MLLLKVAVKSGIQKLPIKEKQVFLIKSENMVLFFFVSFWSIAEVSIFEINYWKLNGLQLFAYK